MILLAVFKFTCENRVLPRLLLDVLQRALLLQIHQFIKVILRFLGTLLLLRAKLRGRRLRLLRHFLVLGKLLIRI